MVDQTNTTHKIKNAYKCLILLLFDYIYKLPTC